MQRRIPSTRYTLQRLVFWMYLNLDEIILVLKLLKNLKSWFGSKILVGKIVLKMLIQHIVDMLGHAIGPRSLVH